MLSRNHFTTCIAEPLSRNDPATCSTSHVCWHFLRCLCALTAYECGDDRDDEAEHDADLAGGDAGGEVAEAAAIGGVGPRQALVVVDHADAVRSRPADRLCLSV